VIANAQTLATVLLEERAQLVSGSTDNHLMLLAVRTWDLTGKPAEALLESAGITVSKNPTKYIILITNVKSDFGSLLVFKGDWSSVLAMVTASRSMSVCFPSANERQKRSILKSLGGIIYAALSETDCKFVGDLVVQLMERMDLGL
jgi:hypothetical protein